MYQYCSDSRTVIILLNYYLYTGTSANITVGVLSTEKKVEHGLSFPEFKNRVPLNQPVSTECKVPISSDI